MSRESTDDDSKLGHVIALSCHLPGPMLAHIYASKNVTRPLAVDGMKYKEM